MSCDLFPRRFAAGLNQNGKKLNKTVAACICLRHHTVQPVTIEAMAVKCITLSSSASHYYCETCASLCALRPTDRTVVCVVTPRVTVVVHSNLLLRVYTHTHTQPSNNLILLFFCSEDDLEKVPIIVAQSNITVGLTVNHCMCSRVCRLRCF